VACGVGCGGPMAPGGDEVSPLKHHRLAGLPLRRRLAEHTGSPRSWRTDAKALALPRVARRCRRLPQLRSDGRLDRCRRGRRPSTAVSSTAGSATPGTSATSSSFRRRACACGGFGCLEAEASGRRSRPSPGARPPRRRRRSLRGRAVPPAVASVANLLDLDLAVVAGSVALGFVHRSSTPQRRAPAPRPPRLLGRGGHRTAGLGDEGPLVGAGAVGYRVPAGGGRWRERHGLRAVVRMVLRHPGLWVGALGAMVRLAPSGWWRRAPFLPLPDPAYWRFRLVTAYGGDGDESALRPTTLPGTSDGVRGCPGRAGSLPEMERSSCSMRPTSRWLWFRIGARWCSFSMGGPKRSPSVRTPRFPLRPDVGRGAVNRAPLAHGPPAPLGTHAAAHAPRRLGAATVALRLLRGYRRQPSTMSCPSRGWGARGTTCAPPARRTTWPRPTFFSPTWMGLPFQPRAPEGHLWRLRHLADVDPLWEPYLARAS